MPGLVIINNILVFNMPWIFIIYLYALLCSDQICQHATKNLISISCQNWTSLSSWQSNLLTRTLFLYSLSQKDCPYGLFTVSKITFWPLISIIVYWQKLQDYTFMKVFSETNLVVLILKYNRLMVKVDKVWPKKSNMDNLYGMEGVWFGQHASILVPLGVSYIN